MCDMQNSYQTVESQEDKIIKTQQTQEKLVHIDCFEVQTMIENPLSGSACLQDNNQLS